VGDREPLSPMFYIGVYAAVSTYQFFEDLQSHLIFQRPDHWCWFVPMLQLLHDGFLSV
jgi:hypothetical protein